MSIWQPLAQGQTPRIYSPGQLIYLQGAEPTEFYYLLSGTVRSFLSSPEGEERVLTLHRGGSLMGEASFFNGGPRVSSAVAVSECRVVAVTWARLESILAEHPQLAIPMLRYLANTVGQLSGQVNALAFQGAEVRLAAQLLREADGDGLVAVTQEELGFQVGATRVTVARVLGKWSRRGWVKTRYGGVRILQPKPLEALIADPVGD